MTIHRHMSPTRHGGILKVLGIGMLLFIGFTILVGRSATKDEPYQEAMNEPTHKESRQEPVKPSPEKSPVVADEPISTVTWQEIDTIYSLGSKVTDLKKDALWKSYQGKKVKWTGTVGEIGEKLFGGIRLGVKMKTLSFGSDLSITLREDQKDKALTLNKGDQITFTGVLKEWGTLVPITLEDGQLVGTASSGTP